MNRTLDLVGDAVENWLFLAVGLPLAALLSGMRFAWAAVRSSLGLPTQGLTCRRLSVQRYLVPMIVTIMGAGLAGCAGQSEQHVQFFKPSGPRPVEQRYLSTDIITVSRTDQAPPSARWGP